MTLIHFLWGALLGATSAIVAIALSFAFLKSFKVRLISSLSLCLLLFTALYVVLEDSKWETKFYEIGIPHYRIKNIMNTHMLALTSVQSVRKELAKMNTEEQKAFLQKITGAGVKRLSTPDLITWNEIRSKLASSDEQFCTGLYTGKLDEETLWRSFAKLDDSDVRVWTQIMIESGRREWEKVDFKSPEVSSLQKGLESIARSLPKEESERLVTVLALGTSNSDESACWAMKKILHGTNDLPADLKEDFLRSLAIQF